ncbi:MAG: dUTP diphosphatase [Nanoarchaeota archaeon]
MVVIKIKRVDKGIILPTYAYKDDAAFDLRSAEDKILAPNEKAILKTGIQVEIPKDHVGLIWDRSGLAANHGITTLGGVADSSYRGEIKVILKNLSNQEFKINKNDRIAQMIIQPYVKAKIVESENLSETERSENGLGSTGVK